MKKILCYGDSNTFGFNPQNGSRYDKNSRWSGVLSNILCENYEIIEEGMNNRTGFFKNPEGLKQSGAQYLPIYLQNHKDIDIFILSLGTNDAQIFYPLDENTVKQGLKNLTNDIKSANEQTKIIIVPPVKITKNLLHSGFSMLFNEDSIAKIKNVFNSFEQFANENNYFYYDFNQIANPSNFDGIHYTQEAHQKIANEFAKFILKI